MILREGDGTEPLTQIRLSERKYHSDQSAPHGTKGIQQQSAQSLTGMYSGSHSGMFRLVISMEIFLRWPGLVTPMAVRSCRHSKRIKHTSKSVNTLPAGRSQLSTDNALNYYFTVRTEPLK